MILAISYFSPIKESASLSTEYPVFIFLDTGIQSFSKRITCTCLAELILKRSPTSSYISSSFNLDSRAISSPMSRSFISSMYTPARSMSVRAGRSSDSISTIHWTDESIIFSMTDSCQEKYARSIEHRCLSSDTL